MPKTKLLFDTNSFQNQILISVSNAKIHFSAIVFMELMTACGETKELKSYQKAFNEADKLDLLITPNKQDVYDAARIQFLLAKDRKDAKGNAPKRAAKIKQELAMDCLIAVSASREKIAVVTNDKDYFEIQRYLKGLKVIEI